jgi:type III polyketide synthase
MSTPIDTPDATGKRFGDLNLSIIGLGTEYPPYLLDPSALDILTSRHYPESSAFVPYSILKSKI